ncbi:MAG: alpha/beta hydrolase [Bacteroidales bacterium]
MNYTTRELNIHHSDLEGVISTERKRMGLLYFINKPSITVYKPEQCNGKAIMIVPGGGYAFSAIDIEGNKFAEWLVSFGYMVALLKYRMPEGNTQQSYKDWLAGFDLFWQECLKNNIETNKIGYMGSSAGAHLSLTAIQRPESIHTPNFAIHLYPLVSLEEPLAHKGSLEKLLGKDATAELRREYSPISNLKNRPSNSIIIYSEDDNVVNPENSKLLHRTLTSLGSNSNIINYKSGGHGWGFNDKFEYHHEMKLSILEFLDKL